MLNCADCGKEIFEESAVLCDMCGSTLCEECGDLGLCLACTELWEAEMDLEDIEAQGC